LIEGRIIFNIFPSEIDISYRSSYVGFVELGEIKWPDGVKSIFSHATYTKYIKPVILSGQIKLSRAGVKIASGEGVER
jgi:hypothetical protein